jgi:hypothetical protein
MTVGEAARFPLSVQQHERSMCFDDAHVLPLVPLCILVQADGLCGKNTAFDGVRATGTRLEA